MRSKGIGSLKGYKILFLGVMVAVLFPLGGLLISSQQAPSKTRSNTLSVMQGSRSLPATLTGNDVTFASAPAPGAPAPAPEAPAPGVLVPAPPPPAAAPGAPAPAPGAPAPAPGAPAPVGTLSGGQGTANSSSTSSASAVSSNSSASNSAGSADSTNNGVPSGMHLVFNANFNGSTLNTTVWGTCYPWASPDGCTNFGNSQEEEWYLPSQDQVYDGVLHLVAEEHATEGTTKSGSPKAYAYRSGMVTTYPSFSFTYGYVQVVAKLPGGNGTWPALWLLPTNESWPPEIDIMENWGNPYNMYSTYHWLSASGPQQSMTKVNSSTNLTQTWNTYAVDWEPSSITWYLNGKVVASYTGSQISSQPMYLLANLAIYGSAPSISSFDIKSVSIYQR